MPICNSIGRNVIGWKESYRTRCLGMGFVALDVIYPAEEGAVPFWAAGGSCGNVLSILSAWGWEAFSAALIGQDLAGRLLRTDLEAVGTRCDCLTIEGPGRTPIVIQRNSRLPSGKGAHSFSRQCPDTGVGLPRFLPYPTDLAEILATNADRWDALYLDRSTQAATLLARAVHSAGGLVMFEPCSRKELEREPELLRYVDVLKYSSDQIEFGSAWLDELPTLLQVRTSGESGLSYRRSGRDWCHLVAIPAERVADPAGAGDWCSAALIDGLGKHGAAGVEEASDSEIVTVLQRGQKFAAANCAHHGARGLMSSIEFWREFQCVNSSDTPATRLANNHLPFGWSPASLTHPLTDNKTSAVRSAKEALPGLFRD